MSSLIWFLDLIIETRNALIGIGVCLLAGIAGVAVWRYMR